jgi:hypothetical protein
MAFGYNTHNTDLWGVSAASLGKTWVHVVAVFVNGSSDHSQLYLDGQPQAMSQTLGVPNAAAVTTTLRVAALPAYPSYYAGMLDELAVWNAELSASDVQTIYNAQENCP